eukprot:CAMPEP_0181385834 /NCGR_PEP_ID=MMETSP1106-20121128/22787_1 /TAXON_ID=81844 /ORGANISM="Mantoniella antarctica, Strain SL-175" /LENGTH=59 /DNA_ID=CAMNT_0023505953 /DNA_START=42 /DNA_END=222 /DNA_ORIENTATION=-
MNAQSAVNTLADFVYLRTAASRLPVSARERLEAAAGDCLEDEVEGTRVDDTVAVQKARP